MCKGVKHIYLVPVIILFIMFFFHNISVNGCYNPINDIEELLNEELNVEEGVKLFNEYSNDMKLLNDEVLKITDLFLKYTNYI